MATPIIGANSRLDLDTLSASVVGATGFTKEVLTDDRPFTFYKMGASGTTLDIITDAGVGNTELVGYFMALGHDFFDPALDGLGAVTLVFASSPDDITYTPIFTVTPTDNFIIARAFVDVDQRFFRLRITRGGAFITSIGQLAWGKPVVFPFGMPVGYDPNAETIMARFNQSQVGNILGSAFNFVNRSAAITLELQPSTFVDDATLGGFREFWDNHGSKIRPFLYMWNAEQDATDVAFEKDSFFGVVDPGSIARPLKTQLDVGFRDLQFQIVGLKETT